MPKQSQGAKSGSTTLSDLRATTAERKAVGQAARDHAPRSGFADWDEQSRGHDPIATVLAQSAGRMTDVVPLRHHRMARSPWNYYRGAAAVMAADLASRPHSGLEVQLCGDAHVLNFGLWATPERHLNFDLRDFDETLLGPFEWDVARLAASLIVAARESGVKHTRSRQAVRAAVDAYRRAMRRYADARELDVWYDGMRVDRFVKYFERADRGQAKVYIEKRKAEKTSRGAFPKLTAMVHGRPRITAQPPIRVTVSDDEQRDVVNVLLAGYRQTLQEDRRVLFDRFTEVDIVRQVVGVGSVGMVVYLVLFEGRSGEDPLFLQCKQAVPSVLEAHLRPAVFANHGQRVIAGKRMVQSATDIFVGWGSLGDRDFYVRQYRDMKVIASTDLIAPRVVQFASACGSTLARAHARSGDALALDAYMGAGSSFTEAMVAFSQRYADQNARDHAELVSAIERGEVPSAAD
ncbi:MAG TPA: DUF2252 domain-containing protein [Acidimicrobiales bacterium]|nr:DUF2252 domain-containing protein [Acidimicrobiales bacterium]